MAKILSRKPVLATPILTVFEDKLLFQDGVKKTHNNIVRDPGVYIFPLDENMNLYLIEQYRYIHDKTVTESIAGLIDKGETPLQAVKRELKEEAGIKAKSWKKIGSFKSAGSIATWDQHLYIAQNLTFGRQELEDTESISVKKVPLKKAVEKVLNGNIIISSTTIGILIIDKMMQKGKI